MKLFARYSALFFTCAILSAIHEVDPNSRTDRSARYEQDYTLQEYTSNLFQSSKDISTRRGDEEVFSFPTLRSWAKEVLLWREKSDPSYDSVEIALSPERSEALKQEKVSLSEINLALDLFIEKVQKSSLMVAQNWVSGRVPDEKFFAVPGFVTKTFFAQKITLPHNTEIFDMGDLHGSVHSLLRYFLRLYVKGVINDNFEIIKPDTHFVFTGDFIDRGSFSSETIYTVIRFKLANFEKVHLIRGNHELVSSSSTFGLKHELDNKYDDDGHDLFNKMNRLFQFFPAVLLVADDNPRPNILHFSHGGFSYSLAEKALVHSPKNLIRAATPLAYEVLNEEGRGYMWSDFHQSEESTHANRGRFSDNSGVALLGRRAFQTYKNEFSPDANLVGIIRGHQDGEFGVKMLFKDEPAFEVLNEIKNRTKEYKNGPFHWIDVVNEKAGKGPGTELATIPWVTSPTTINLSSFFPVITVTSASEGRGVPYDAYVVVKRAERAEDYQLEIHETPLLLGAEREGFMIVSSPSATDDGIKVEWVKSGQGKLSIDGEHTGTVSF